MMIVFCRRIYVETQPDTEPLALAFVHPEHINPSSCLPSSFLRYLPNNHI